MFSSRALRRVRWGSSGVSTRFKGCGFRGAALLTVLRSAAVTFSRRWLVASFTNELEGSSVNQPIMGADCILSYENVLAGHLEHTQSSIIYYSQCARSRISFLLG